MSRLGDWGDAAQVIRQGGVVIAPTDTVHGLLCDPQDLTAVERIHTIKARPLGMELPLLIPDISALKGIAHVETAAARLAAAFWPGALTLVLSIHPSHPLVIPRWGTTLAVRVPAHRELLGCLEVTGPLASTSANRHGAHPATDAATASAALGDAVDLVVRGRSASGLASTIVTWEDEGMRVLRVGAIPAADLASVVD